MKAIILGVLVALIALSGMSSAVDTGKESKVKVTFECPITFSVDPAEVTWTTAATPETFKEGIAAITTYIKCCGGYGITAKTDSAYGTAGHMTVWDVWNKLRDPFYLRNTGAGSYRDMSNVANQGYSVTGSLSGTTGDTKTLDVYQYFSLDDTPGNYVIKVVLTASTAY